MIARKHEKHLCFSWLFKRAPVIIVLFIVGLCPFSADALDILLGTGETGSFSYFTGRTICGTLNRHADGINCKVVAGPDDMSNLTNLRGGALDIGLVDSRMLYDAVNKAGNFEFLDIGRLLSRENRRHGKKMSFYFLFMPRIAVGSNAFDRRSVSGACQVG